jgi:ubiquinone/menaquinone biosynthesis C-methylase UbiE
MTIRDRFMAGLAQQLGRPEGLRGRVLSQGLNRGNRAVIEAAVDACGLGPGGDGADIGFGGGIGLALLLEQVGDSGRVIGVDLSDTMIQAAAKRFREPCAAGRLTLTQGNLMDLPLASGELDGLITVNTIYFVDDLAGALSEVARTLRPDGRAVLGLADPGAMAKMPLTAHGFRLRPVEEVIEVASRSGLPHVRHDRVGSGKEAYHLLIASPTYSGEGGD